MSVVSVVSVNVSFTILYSVARPAGLWAAASRIPRGFFPLFIISLDLLPYRGNLHYTHSLGTDQLGSISSTPGYNVDLGIGCPSEIEITSDGQHMFAEEKEK